MELPISKETWNNLVEAHSNAVKSGWAENWLVATGKGQDYECGGRRSVHYIGKSPGFNGAGVGLETDQLASANQATSWMEGRRTNKSSGFWKVAERLSYPKSMAWSNICKIDQRGKECPDKRSWDTISAISMVALREEVEHLKPKLLMFVTSEFGRFEIQKFLQSNDFVIEADNSQIIGKKNVELIVHKSISKNRWAIQTVHPGRKSLDVWQFLETEAKKILARN